MILSIFLVVGIKKKVSNKLQQKTVAEETEVEIMYIKKNYLLKAFFLRSYTIFCHWKGTVTKNMYIFESVTPGQMKSRSQVDLSEESFGNA